MRHAVHFALWHKLHAVCIDGGRHVVQGFLGTRSTAVGPWTAHRSVQALTCGRSNFGFGGSGDACAEEHAAARWRDG